MASHSVKRFSKVDERDRQHVSDIHTGGQTTRVNICRNRRIADAFSNVAYKLVPECIKMRNFQWKKQKIFCGGALLSPRPLSTGERDSPSSDSTPLGAFGTRPPFNAQCLRVV